MTSLVRFIEEFDPGFASTVRGATDAEIDALERIVCRALPVEYRDFLREMGHDLGRFQPFGDDVDFRLAAVAELYRDADWEPPEGYQCIGVDALSSHVFLALEGEAGSGGALARPIVNLDDHPEPYRLYESLPAMLFGLAFLLKRLPLLPFVAHLTVSTDDPWGGGGGPVPRHGDRTPEFAELASSLGFEPVAETGGWFSCYDRPEGALLSFRSESSAPEFRVAAADERELDRLVQVVGSRLRLWRSA